MVELKFSRIPMIVLAIASVLVLTTLLFAQTVTAAPGNPNSNSQGTPEVLTELAAVQQQIADLRITSTGA